VMYAGRVVERADVFSLFERPLHPYTRGLLASIPRLDSRPKQRLATIAGQVPSLQEMPSGCRFRNRCPHAQVRCAEQVPPEEGAQGAAGHALACHFWRQWGDIAGRIEDDR